MKLNLDEGRLRLRMSEAELERLLADGEVSQGWLCPDASIARCTLRLRSDAHVGSASGDLMDFAVVLPRDRFTAFAAERPRRDGFEFAAGALRVVVDVDVRDSRRHRADGVSGKPGRN